MPHAAVGEWSHGLGESEVDWLDEVGGGRLADSLADQRVAEHGALRRPGQQLRVQSRAQVVAGRLSPGDGADCGEDLGGAVAVVERGDAQDQGRGVGQGVQGSGVAALQTVAERQCVVSLRTGVRVGEGGRQVDQGKWMAGSLGEDPGPQVCRQVRGGAVDQCAGGVGVKGMDA